MHPDRQRSWRTGNDTNRNILKGEITAAGYLQIRSENLSEWTTTQLVTFGNEIGNHVERNENKLGRSIGLTEPIGNNYREGTHSL